MLLPAELLHATNILLNMFIMMNSKEIKKHKQHTGFQGPH